MLGNLVGLDNYQKLLNNAFYASLKTTTLVTVCNCVVLIVLPMLLALLLNNLHLRGETASGRLFYPRPGFHHRGRHRFRMMFADTETGAINSIFIAWAAQQRFMLQYGWSIFLMVFLTPGRAPVCI